MDDGKIRDIIGTIERHSVMAAAAGGASAILPGAGAALSMMSCIGFVTAMYVKTTKKVGIRISKVKLKAIASAILAEIASKSVVSFAGGVIISFIPGLSNISMAVGQYAFTYMSGVMYLSFLKDVFGAGASFEEMTTEAIEAKISEIGNDMDIGNIVKELANER